MSSANLDGVFTALPSYLAAVAELPVSAALAATHVGRWLWCLDPAIGGRACWPPGPGERRRWCLRTLLCSRRKDPELPMAR